MGELFILSMKAARKLVSFQTLKNTLALNERKQKLTYWDTTSVAI